MSTKTRTARMLSLIEARKLHRPHERLLFRHWTETIAALLSAREHMADLREGLDDPQQAKALCIYTDLAWLGMDADCDSDARLSVTDELRYLRADVDGLLWNIDLALSILSSPAPGGIVQNASKRAGVEY